MSILEGIKSNKLHYFIKMQLMIYLVESDSTVIVVMLVVLKML